MYNWTSAQANEMRINLKRKAALWRKERLEADRCEIFRGKSESFDVGRAEMAISHAMDTKMDAFNRICHKVYDRQALNREEVKKFAPVVNFFENFRAARGISTTASMVDANGIIFSAHHMDSQYLIKTANRGKVHFILDNISIADIRFPKYSVSFV